MRKIKKIIIILLILLIVCIVSILIINKSNKQQVEIPTNAKEQNSYNEKELREDYFAINSCIREYLSAININNSAYYRRDKDGNYVKDVEEDVIKTKIYNLLSSEFISENAITLENIYNKIETIDKSAIFIPYDIELINKSEVSTYYVHGLVEDISNYNIIMELRAFVNLDKTNNTFAIDILKEKYKEEDISELQSIEKNENNKLNIESINTQKIAENYLKLYKGAVLGNPELVYSYLLDDEYKNKRFKNLEEFKEYIQNNKDLIFGARVKKYGVNSSNGYNEYLVIDQNGKNYFFKENKIMDYSILLDNYTIDNKAFLEEYNSANEQGKVALNIQKFIQSINDKDYRYAYNCLAQEFRNNYFTTQKSFEEYVKQNLYNRNKVNFIKFNVSDSVYTYKIEILNMESEVGEKMEKTIIMRLNNGTDFEMSFNVD